MKLEDAKKTLAIHRKRYRESVKKAVSKEREKWDRDLEESVKREFRSRATQRDEGRELRSSTAGAYGVLVHIDQMMGMCTTIAEARKAVMETLGRVREELVRLNHAFESVPALVEENKECADIRANAEAWIKKHLLS